MDKNTCKNILIVVLLLFVLLLNYKYNKHENFTTEQSNEAVQNISKVYADTSGTVSFNNVNITGKIYSPTQKNYMQLSDDGNLYIYDKNGNKITSIGTNGFINPTNPTLRYDDTGYYLAMQTDGDMCVNNGKGASGNIACVGNSGLLGVRLCDLNSNCIAPNNIQSISDIQNSVKTNKYCNVDGSYCYTFNNSIPGVYFGSPYYVFQPTKS